MSQNKGTTRAIEFVKLADLFLQAFEQIREPWPPIPVYDWPRYFLLCHSMELTLKAFLHIKGISEQELKKEYSHKLAKLFEAAFSYGLVETVRSKQISHYYDKLHKEGWSRYPLPEDKKREPIADVSTFAPEARRLLCEVKKLVETS